LPISGQPDYVVPVPVAQASRLPQLKVPTRDDLQVLEAICKQDACATGQPSSIKKSFGNSIPIANNTLQIDKLLNPDS
jgi:hypothetical protein